MTSATEVLRRLLDECGEVWGANDTYRLLVTSWDDARGHSWSFMEHRDGSFSKLTAYHLTPEQAIAVTLCSCNCTNSCTNGERTGTCHVESSIIDTYEYNRWEYELSCGHTIIWEDSEPPRYCPICGRSIEQ